MILGVTGKDKIWEALNSAWLAMAFVPFLNWAAFLWIGYQAKQRKWKTAGWLYLALAIPVFIGAVVFVVMMVWPLAAALYVLHFSAWIASIVHALRSRREYLVRREAVVAKLAGEHLAYRERILSENQPPPVVVASAQDIFRSKGLSPEGIRKYLGQLGARHPGAAALLDDCAKQIASVQTRRANLNELIELNSAGYLTDATGALREAEQLILQNLMWVINRGIVAETGGGPAAPNDGDPEFSALIRQVLAANNEVLVKCRTLVAGASDLISGKGSTGSTAAIEAWIVAIRQQVRSSTLTIKED